MGVGKRTVDDFLEALASPSPTPGGGSVAALCGALSVALSRMVSSLAVGKEGYEAVQADLRDLEGRAKALQGRLVGLADEDARAYDSVIAAMRLPKKTDAERAARVEAMQAAYRHATEVPLETMQSCAEALELALLAAQKGNRRAITDAGVAALTAEAGLRAASLNVRINLSALKDNEFRARVEEKMPAILRDADRVGHATMDLVEGLL